MDNAITKTGVLARRMGVLRRKERKFYFLTNAGGLFYAKSIAQEFTHTKNLTSITRQSVITLETSGSFGEKPSLVCRVQTPDTRMNRTMTFELEAMGDAETKAWHQAMLDVVELLEVINGDSNAAQPRPLQGIEMGAEGWYLEPTGRMALYKFNQERFWTIVDKGEYDEATVSRCQGSGRSRGQGGGEVDQYSRSDDRASPTNLLIAKARAGGALTNAEIQALQAAIHMTPSVASGEVPIPMMAPPGMAVEYATPSAGPRGRGLASGSGNGSGVMVPMGMRSPVPGVSPVGPGVHGGMGDSSVPVISYAPVGVVGGATTGPPVMGVGGPVRFDAAPPEVSTGLPSTFAVGKSGDTDDADTLVLRRRRNVVDEEAVGGSGVGGSGVGGEVAGATNSGRLPRSPAMQVLQGSIIA